MPADTATDLLLPPPIRTTPFALPRSAPSGKSRRFTLRRVALIFAWPIQQSLAWARQFPSPRNGIIPTKYSLILSFSTCGSLRSDSSIDAVVALPLYWPKYHLLKPPPNASFGAMLRWMATGAGEETDGVSARYAYSPSTVT